APLMIIIELIAHLARVMSLSFRLFGNIMAEDMIMILLISLAGKFFAPFPMFFLFTLNAFIQAFIFTMLTMMYISGSLEEAH
ncbi:MAG: F0F1 ATP synthase subunit A, partial [Deltaproteobacteria bacterium]|nr:F0F1 ATP synthase subunit A [Deltaproteobacteria bacterium]